MVEHLPPTLGLNDRVAILAVVGMLSCVVFYIVHSIRAVRETREREQTRREIAAYVAEGSITPDGAAKILNSDISNPAAAIADGVAWGTISPGKAERLLRAMRSDAPTSPPTPLTPPTPPTPPAPAAPPSPAAPCRA